MTGGRKLPGGVLIIGGPPIIVDPGIRADPGIIVPTGGGGGPPIMLPMGGPITLVSNGVPMAIDMLCPRDLLHDDRMRSKEPDDIL